MPKIEKVHAGTGVLAEIKPFTASTLPNNFMLCDGTAISRTTYASFAGGGSSSMVPTGTSAGSQASTIATISDGTNGTPRTGTVTKPANVAINYIIRVL